MIKFSPGSIVRCREREWVVLPSVDEELLLLRSLGGSEDEVTGIYLPLNAEIVEPASFPPPDLRQSGDATAARLLWQAARLNLRSGAGPFRSLGHLQVRPRPYQIVPLLMALRLDPVRLLIADDVGVGKTIEAGLIARELLDRGEIRRVAVICPPYLCEQWQQELASKFNLQAVVIRSGTVAQLERGIPLGNTSIFEYYPHFVASVDFIKSERYRASFLLHCPDLVIVDEAHTCAQPAAKQAAQQQRHELLRELASHPGRHLILLTATPHSGVEESFQSLLALLKPQFASFNLQALSEKNRAELARHLVQRRRADVKKWLGEDTPFPERDSLEEVYDLSPDYMSLFKDVYSFAGEIVRSGETLSGWRQRLRYWTALALLRCVMSSPAAAEAALLERVRHLEEKDALGEEDEDLFTRYVYDPAAEEVAIDVAPARVVDEGEAVLPENERRRLRSFARRAAALKGDKDNKVARLAEIIDRLLSEGYHPIVYCRYIATSDYVVEELKRRLGPKWPDLQVISVTGELAEEERQERVRELAAQKQRVLVATDCLSEGINLQEHFNAVVHYDLPWNPNRLEQREGRVDRFGQTAARVKTVLLYGRDNPVDGAVLEVLIRKAVQIRRTLGISVPVPVDSETVMEAVLKSLFLHTRPVQEIQQLTIFDLAPELPQVHRAWDQAVERERESRTRFAQHAIHPEEVLQELQETDAVLGDQRAVESFIVAACERLGAPIRREKGGWLLDPSPLPLSIRERLGASGLLRLSFDSPAPEGFVFVGRNHPLTGALAEYLFNSALDPAGDGQIIARSGVIRTTLVPRRTTLLLLRLRYLLEASNQAAPLLAEEVVVAGWRGRPGQLERLEQEEALRLLEHSRPEANVSTEERMRILQETAGWLEELSSLLQDLAQERALKLHQAHRRVRRITREGRLVVRPQLPPDILGIYVLMPVPKGVAAR
ncbi:helicase-related protein [Neomoorella humiferrea]|uniref:RNA polymerase-associated protein RapA n=1 Tax=Neomoorella humiferrea TaxID=676965 RepID=A0A2T0AQF3_9FIRM|nr:helicase-related protein [Moorella humiferrea]PRR71265.1 RNA polymerase-associated protein RapA [Moorella humiferrea]